MAKWLRYAASKMRFMAYFDKAFVKAKVRDIPMVFIIGPPRSGTTLLYQYMVTMYSPAYISNIASVFPHCPALITRLTKLFVSKPSTINFNSNHGFIKGSLAPSEAGEVMNVWFNSALGLPEVSSQIQRITELENQFFVCKNVWNSRRIKKIAKVPGKPMIIHVYRDIYSNAHSILSSASNGVTILEEFSGLTRGLEHSQAVSNTIRNIIDYHCEVEQAIIDSGVDSISIQYEEFCSNPSGIMREVMQKMGVSHTEEEINNFKFKATILDNVERDNLKRCVDQGLLKIATRYETVV